MKCICYFRYARTRQGGAHFPDVRGLLRYLQFRENRNDHIPSAGGPNRWIDGGLGANYQEILARLDHLSAGNRNVYCFSVVISPDPEAMAAVDGDPYERFVRTVQSALDRWEEWRQAHDPRPQAGRIEYSLVVHRPARPYGEQMRAHLILPAATEHPATGDMTPLYNNKPHVEAFKEIVYHQLDRAFVLERDPERQRQPVEREPEQSPWERMNEPDRQEDDPPDLEIEFFPFFER